MTQETELPALPEPFDDWWEREGKAGNPFDLRRAFNAGRASAGPCGCREGECESKVGPRCRMANEVTTAAVLAEREAIIAMMPGGNSVDPQWVCDAIRARGIER